MKTELRFATGEDGIYLDEICADGFVHFEMLGYECAMLRFGPESQNMVTVLCKDNRLYVSGLQDWQDDAAAIIYKLDGKRVDKEPLVAIWDKAREWK